MEKKKGISKRALRTKLVLLIVLAAVMIPLIIIYKAVGDTTPRIKLYDRNQVTEAPEAQTSEETVPVSEPNAEETQSAEPQTQAPAPKNPAKNAVIASVTDPENWAVAIINTQYPLPDSYSPTLSNAIDGSDIQLDSRVSEQYAQMYAAAKQAGCVLTPYSGYHTYTLQDNTYKRKVNFYVSQGMSAEEAAAKAQQQVLPAGCSEHNAGLAMDIVSASSDFVNTKEYKWL